MEFNAIGIEEHHSSSWAPNDLSLCFKAESSVKTSFWFNKTSGSSSDDLRVSSSFSSAFNSCSRGGWSSWSFREGELWVFAFTASRSREMSSIICPKPRRIESVSRRVIWCCSKWALRSWSGGRMDCCNWEDAYKWGDESDSWMVLSLIVFTLSSAAARAWSIISWSVFQAVSNSFKMLGVREGWSVTVPTSCKMS